jgi:adenosine deaminase
MESNQGSNTPSAHQPASFPLYPLAELHAHLGASISPTVLWQIAHSNGIKLPKTEFKDFCDFIMLSPERRMKLDTYFQKVYHPVLDRISSGTHAVEQGTYQTMSGAYQANGITTIELRNNPMKHNMGAALDLDHIIMAMIHGMERALLEHPQLSAGILFCMDRTFSVEQNSIILEKAIKYHRRGVIGIDVAGPASSSFHIQDYADLFTRAKKAGLRVTVHSGEVAEATDMWDALKYAEPERFGHGIRAAYDIPLMKELARRGTVLEVCPMSNLMTKAVKNLDEIQFILRTFINHKVRFCINTDWPEIIVGCRLRAQLQMLRDKGILTEAEIADCNQTAFEASFIPKPGNLASYL